MKKIIAGILSATVLVSSVFAAVPADFSDIPDNWAKEPIEHAIENGLLNGSNGKINPMGNLTRAEMCAIIGRTVKAQTVGSIQFSDVSSADWFYQDVAKAYAMGVVAGDGNTMRPNAPISRQETMVVLSRLFQLTAEQGESVLGSFADAADVASWAKDGVAAMIESGYVAGANGKINPSSNITRAEFAAIMDRMVNTYISESEVVTGAAGKNIMINTVGGGTTLKDTDVAGNLIIGDGVGEGDITLDNVNVSGKVIVRGGGANSIHFVNSSAASSVILAKPQGAVRVTTDEASKITAVEAKTGDAKIEGSVETVTVSAEKAAVTLENATVSQIVVDAPSSTVTVSAGSEINVGTVASDAIGSKIVVAKDATVGKLNVSASNVTVSGEGKVAEAEVTASNVQVNTNNTSITVSNSASNVTAGSQNIESGKTTVTDSNTSSQTPGGSTTNPDDNQGNNQGGNQGGSSGGSTNDNKPDNLNSFIVYGTHEGSSEVVRLATGTVADTKCVVDLSSLALTDAITSGEATTEYGNNLMIGSYPIPTNKVVTVNDLYKIIAADSETSSISIGALKNLIADEEMLKTVFEAKTGKEFPSEYITIGENSFTVKTTITRSGVTRTFTIEVRLPA